MRSEVERRAAIVIADNIALLLDATADVRCSNKRDTVMIAGVGRAENVNITRDGIEFDVLVIRKQKP